MFEDEHHGPSVPESNPELGFRLHWFGVGLLAVIGCGGNVSWAAGTLSVLGLVGFALLIANREVFAGSMKTLILRTAGWMLPAWFVLVTFVIGLNFPAYRGVTQGGRKWWELLPLPSMWTPVEGAYKTAGVEVLLVVSLFTATLSAMLLCKSRLVFARTWAMLVFCAAGFAVLGLAQFATHADKILWLVPLDNPQFFSTFPHPAQWSAFALLWMGAALGLLAWLVRQRGWRWLSGEGWALLISVFALGFSIAVTGDPLHLILAMLVGAVGCLVMGWQTRVERVKANRSGLAVGALAWIALGLALFGGATQIVVHHPFNEWINYAGGGTAMHERVIEDTQTMWLQRKWFGWGPGSFRVVYSFFQGSDQSRSYYAYARSDLWQSLAEHGILGTVVWWIPGLWILGRLLWQRRLATFLFAPLAGVVAIVVLSVVDFPLASPAVFFGFWLILFSLGRWSGVDQESTASNPSERRRVEKLRSQGQTLPPKPAPTAPAS